MRIDPEEYERLDLRAHALLADVPLHDVWALDLPGGGPGRTLVDLRQLLAYEDLTSANGALRLLFGLRSWLGRLFGWDRRPPGTPAAPSLSLLSPADREASLVVPGTPEGPFRILYLFPGESLSEIQNSTVHAFLVYAWREGTGGYRLYWAIYVRPIGRITWWYMQLIDPFRRLVVYPAILRTIRSRWTHRFSQPG